MTSTAVTDASREIAPLAAPDPRRLPAWLASLVLHVTVLVSLGLLYRPWQPGEAPEPLRTTGIALVQQVAGQVEYFDGSQANESVAAAEAQAASASAASAPLPELANLPLDPAGLLPAGNDALAAALAGDGLPDARDMLRGAAGGDGLRGLGPGQTYTKVFGAQGYGTKFIYVFDRSGSMGGYEGRPLAAAKRELLQSLDDLRSTHQFQIIFYNQDPQVFALRGGTTALAFGDDASKALARRFVEGVVASGGTRHVPPLMLALNLAPDAIFFLTDADEPILTADELARIRRANKGSAIHAIEFGFGPQANPDNFLVRLARENGGQHVYVDVTRLGR